MHFEYMFCFICSKQCIQIISSRKKCGLFSSVSKKIIPNNTTPTFQEVGGHGVTQPLIFGVRTSQKLFVAFPWVVTITGPGRFMVLCVFYDGNSRKLNESGFMEKPGLLMVSRLIDFYSEVELLICLPLFLIKMNQNAKS